jgi:hypothetical protein
MGGGNTHSEGSLLPEIPEILDAAWLLDVPWSRWSVTSGFRVSHAVLRFAILVCGVGAGV